MKTQTLILALAAVVFTTGCTTMKSRFDNVTKVSSLVTASSDSDGQADLPEFKTPQKMLAIWKDSVRTLPNKPAMRGFGGRIYLYDQSGAAVRAQGELVIYGFDDSVKERDGSKADQKIVIRNDELQQFYSKSALGPSYSVWVDWDKAGSADKSVTLVPFFRTPEGEIIKAGPAIYTLHTPKGDTLDKEKLVSHVESDGDGMSAVSQANYLQSDGDKNAVVQASGLQKLSRPRSSVRTTTISLPKETQKRLRETSFGSEKPMDPLASKDLTQGKPMAAKGAEKATRPKLPSRLDEARKKRHEQIKNGNVFGMPGQL